MPDQIILLGVKGGPSLRQKGAMPTSSVLQLGGQTILIDCGIGVARSAVEAGIALISIDTIFITHLHSDHVLELGPLLYTTWTNGLSREITVYGPAGIENYWQRFLEAMSFDHAIRVEDEGRPDLRDLVKIKTFGEGAVAQLDGIAVTSLRVEHPPVIECYALRFDHGQTSVVFSADTCYFPPLAAFARDADVLVHEAMLPAGVDNIVRRTPNAGRLREHLEASHTSAEDVGRIAKDAGVGQLVLNHLVPADDPAFGAKDWMDEVAKSWDGNTTVGHDGLVVSLG